MLSVDLEKRQEKRGISIGALFPMISDAPPFATSSTPVSIQPQP